MSKEKPKPEVTMSHYVVLALFSFVAVAAWLSDEPQFHQDPFYLIIVSGILAHLIAYGGLCLLVGIGVMRNSD